MRVEYRIIFTMTFDIQKDRDEAFAKIKSSLVNTKSQLPGYRESHLTKDDYPIPESITEAF